MDENQLRWRGRIGALRSSAVGIAILALLGVLILALGPLPTALRNPTEPQATSLGQIVGKEFSTGEYVTVSGRGIFGAGITESDDNGTLVGFIYPVADDDNGVLLYVRSAQPKVDAPKNDDEEVTITGIVRAMPSSVKALIDRDLPDIESAGFTTASDVCLVQGQKPGNANLLIVATALLGLLALLCLATLPFPHPVFGRHPVEPSGLPASVAPGVKATGRFRRLKKVDPVVEVGRGTRMFREAIANVITLEDGRLLIYVQHVAKYGNTGITISRTHWGLFPEPQNTIEVEPGKVYGWKDRAAVRLRTMDEKGKAQDVIVSFGHGAAQAEFISLLKQRGFSIGGGV